MRSKEARNYITCNEKERARQRGHSTIRRSEAEGDGTGKGRGAKNGQEWVEASHYLSPW